MSFSIDGMKGALIVSCQAYPGEPLRQPDIMARMAESVVNGGAGAVRVQGLEDIRATVRAVDVPVIGLVKEGKTGVFITPTLKLAREAADAGADIVALDGTLRRRPDGLSFAQTVARLRESHEVIIMADCDSVDSACAAHEAGADLIGTTLAGYTDARPKTEGPDLSLVRDIVAAIPAARVVAEGRIHTPEEAADALKAGAFAVVVGTAITHPSTITTWFAERLTG